LSDFQDGVLKPLPGPLPEGERVLWQRSPSWQAYSKRVFHVSKFVLYFLVVITWVAVSRSLSGGMSSGLNSLIWTVPLALIVVGMLSLMGWMYARTTVYTMTSKRLIIQSGLAFTTAVNLPFSKLDKADLKTFADGTGDIELSMSGTRMLYSMIWPNARLLKLKRPAPMLWALPEPNRVAELLSNALAADNQPGESPAENRVEALRDAAAS
jgi:hypothetical protein